MFQVSAGKSAMNVSKKENSGNGRMMGSIELVFDTLSHLFLPASVDIGECLSSPAPPQNDET